jgi:hypothetical protein
VGAVSAGAASPKVLLLTSERLLLSMKGSGSLGTALATRLQTSSPPVGRGREGGCPGSIAGLKENSLSPSSRGEWFLRAHAPPKVKCARTHGLDTRAHSHTLVCTHAHTRTHILLVGVRMQSCSCRELELGWTGLSWRLERSLLRSREPQMERRTRGTSHTVQSCLPLLREACRTPECLEPLDLPAEWSGCERLGQVPNLGHPGLPTCFV